MKIKILLILFLSIFLILNSITQEKQKNKAVALKLAGVPNLYKVSDNFYRSAQPAEQGFEELKKIGIKTIINFRAFHSDEKSINDINYFWIPMHAYHTEEEDVIQFLKIISDSRNSPVLIHCLHGADRTGTMSAIYRIVMEGWTKEEAINEMTHGGFGFHKFFSNLIKFIQKLNIEEIKIQAGLK